MARVVVVGAGMGGLSVAARLAAQGHQVTVCEKAPTVGGKLGTYSRDGFTFDTGPSLLTLPAVYRDLFIKTGAPLETVVDLEPVDPVCHYRFPDGTELDMPNVSRVAIARSLDDALGGSAGAQWLALLDHAHQLWQVTREPFLESELTARDLLRLSRSISDLRTVAPWRSLRQLGRRHLRDPRLRMLLDRYATYTGSDPRRAPSALAVVPYVEQAFGAWYVRGGMRRLGEAVHERAVARGATVRTGCEVVEVLTTAGRASGVRLADGDVIPADVVVSNADAQHVYGTLLAPELAAAARRRLSKATPSLSGFVLLLALDGRTPSPRHHSVLFPQDYDAEFDAVFGGRPVEDPTVYISAPDDSALRPDDSSDAWFVLVNAPRHEPGSGTDWDAPGTAQAYAQQVLAVMAARGVDVRHRIRWCETRTPADLERATGAPGGAIYGTSSNGVRAAFLRPGNRSPVPGLFLVGGSAHPGGGLPLVGLSAAIVAESIGSA